MAKEPVAKLPELLSKEDHFEMLFLHEKFKNVTAEANAIKAIIVEREAALKTKYSLKDGDSVLDDGKIQRK